MNKTELAESSLSRIISGGMATWARVGVTVITQVALVPLYLSKWDIKIFGAWLLLQAVWSTVSVVDLAHHDYVGYECLRLGPERRADIGRIILSAVPVAVLIALWDLLLVFLLSREGFVMGWIGYDAQLFVQWRSALLLQAFTGLFTVSLGGLVRAC
ncbi:hypothetical protein [Chlorobium sp. N1]|uniref:hypothetical protein n=1 Tax=Chlorobium sp. N1 TaxID=2491138 RepID=UPI00103F73CC|nr:hypothetical protein [Chlorobium sp. N1]TCD47187.1 hypothetical protein E0L29_09770 [Chlorobium sp. N1]